MTLSILAFGYWHSITHASFYVSLTVAGAAADAKTSTPEAKVQFLDSKGTVLANGVRDQQYNYVHLIHPTYGDCHEAEEMAAFSKEARTTWQACYERQSAWIAKWINDVDKVNVTYGNCVVKDTPIIILQSDSYWYLWWVPHPHIGGKPYSDYSSTIAVDEKDCVVNRQ